MPREQIRRLPEDERIIPPLDPFQRDTPVKIPDISKIISDFEEETDEEDDDDTDGCWC